MRYLAFYLPQFYPFPENDTWWGKGFTEWTNVTKARPLFDGHYQPRLPTDLGFYDLRVRESQREQIALAKAYGIDGFCFHYYWFDGKRLLDVPVDGFLSDPAADFPFCLCFANENWTRRWDGAERHVLIEQSYRQGWEADFVSSLLPYINDQRYIRVDGRPLLVIYRPQHFPDARASIERLREAGRLSGIGEIHLCSALVHGNWDYESFGFDSGVEFPPHNIRAPNLVDFVESKEKLSGYIFSFADVATGYLSRNYKARTVYRTVFPSWDNTARTGQRAQIILDGTPQNYRIWLSKATQKTLLERAGDEQIVFINAWNEWAEGCHLEPDRHFGRAFLEATLQARSIGINETVPEFSLAESTRVAGHNRIQVDASPASVRRVRAMLEPFPGLQRTAGRVYRGTRRAARVLVRAFTRNG